MRSDDEMDNLSPPMQVAIMTTGTMCISILLSIGWGGSPPEMKKTRSLHNDV